MATATPNAPVQILILDELFDVSLDRTSKDLTK